MATFSVWDHLLPYCAVQLKRKYFLPGIPSKSPKILIIEQAWIMHTALQQYSEAKNDEQSNILWAQPEPWTIPKTYGSQIKGRRFP